jgi:AraC-like DNA-binding protein
MSPQEHMLSSESLKTDRKSIAVDIMLGNQLEQEFLKKAIDYIHQNLTDTELSVKNLAYYLLISRSQTYRKIKALTGQSATEFIRTIRLKMAITLLEEGKFSIAEIGYKVGFTSPAYFTKCFRLQFGKSPSEYITNSGKKNDPEIARFLCNK